MRELMLRVAWAFLGRWYIWGGDDPSGFDCSGYVLECLQSIGLVDDGWDTTAEGLWKRFEDSRIRGPKRGALVFWENKDGVVCHVEMCLDEWFSIGARGGSAVTDEASAKKLNAYIKVRPISGRLATLRGFLDPVED